MPRTKNKRREPTAEEVSFSHYLEYIHLSNSHYWTEQNKKLRAIRAAYRTNAIPFRTYQAMRKELKEQEN